MFFINEKATKWEVVGYERFIEKGSKFIFSIRVYNRHIAIFLFIFNSRFVLPLTLAKHHKINLIAH